MRTSRAALVIGALAALASVAGAAEPRVALERFLARTAGTALRDLTLEQDLTVFNPEGRAAFATGTQRLVVRFPDQQRVEQVVEGRTEVRLTVRGRTWRRGPDGAVTTLPTERAHAISAMH